MLERTDLEKAKLVLKDKLMRLMPKPGDFPLPFGGVCLHRWHTPTKPTPRYISCTYCTGSGTEDGHLRGTYL